MIKEKRDKKKHKHESYEAQNRSSFIENKGTAQQEITTRPQTRIIKDKPEKGILCRTTGLISLTSQSGLLKKTFKEGKAKHNVDFGF